MVRAVVTCAEAAAHRTRPATTSYGRGGIAGGSGQGWGSWDLLGNFGRTTHLISMTSTRRSRLVRLCTAVAQVEILVTVNNGAPLREVGRPAPDHHEFP